MGRAALLALAIALTACARRPPVVLGERMPAGCVKNNMQSERCFGWLFDRMLMTVAFKRYREPAIEAYVVEIGERLAAAVGDRRRWTFRVLDDDSPQAYAGFNATIYITRGALAILRDEAELAAVLAHEMGHTLAGHHREDLAAMFRDTGDFAQWRDLRYARDDEIQADELAVVYLARAGYDTHAVERMLRALGGVSLAQAEDDAASNSRHPIWRERIVRASALAVRHPRGERHAERYTARVAELVVGTDPRTVAVVGDSALFARAGLALDLPPGTKTLLIRGMLILAMPGEIVATAQLLDRHVAKENTTPREHTAVHVAGDTALAITVMKDASGNYDYVEVAQRLRAGVRTPRADEVARLHPMRFDPTKPRVVWTR